MNVELLKNSQPNEEWKEMIGYYDYFISNKGRIWVESRRKFLTPQQREGRKPYYKIRYNGKEVQIPAFKLIYNYFGRNALVKNKPGEVWKTHKDFPNYEVSSYGRIFSINTGEILKLNTDKDGYYTINLFNNTKKYTTFKVHKLVAILFIDNKDPDKFNSIDHIDGNKLNNRIDNLRWVDELINRRNPISLKERAMRFAANKEDNKNHAYPIRCKETKEIFYGVDEAKRRLNISISSACIRAYCRGERKTPVEGFTFEYVNKTEKDNFTPIRVTNKNLVRVEHKPIQKSNIKVRCIETNQIFHSTEQAKKYLGISISSACIRAYCRGERKTPVEGFTFEYVK